ncbi:hypothetical protein WR25_21671 [Diploscapter pachys]|uniref:Uncharacterized protein n=1 Tax=Diploscapter pachys TaxID=2018661 RepID=A0A2A2LC66_9BILA|nr:hypothetical protein WR25_21671 [Diploscapter pachys]
MVITFSTKTNLAMSGIVDDVGGRIFETSRRNTTMESSTDIVSVIFSVESVGKKNTATESNAITTVGMISTIV